MVLKIFYCPDIGFRVEGGGDGYPQTERWGRATSGDKGLTVVVMEEERNNTERCEGTDGI